MAGECAGFLQQLDSELRLRAAAGFASGRVPDPSGRPAVGVRRRTRPWFGRRSRFTELVRHARGDLDANEPQAAIAGLRQALDLWHGSALTGLDTAYFEQRRDELESARRPAARLLGRIYLDSGRPDEAIDLLRVLVAEDAGNEPSTILLILALTAVGDSTAAADLAVHAIRALRREGRELSPALRQAQSDVLSGHAAGGSTASSRVPSGTGAGARLSQLPFDTRAFTGREHELAELLELADPSGPQNTPDTVVISAIDGMGGVGKTALALHAAHILTRRFPDGQLFVDLQGVHERTPRDPGDVLAEFLQAFGVPPGGIPAETTARAAAFGDRFGRHPDPAGVGQRRQRGTGPAAAAGHRRMSGPDHQPAASQGLDDAFPLNLDALPTADAVALFHSIATPGRVSPEDPLLEEVVALCGHLPLALRITAALLRSRRSWTVQHLAASLRAGQANLRGFSDGDRDLTSVGNRPGLG
ncbi:bacterial transcriptional activator domain-containing protein [Catenulispora yoronensis]|uniref:AfsR/SARP family transcriptional regulator n=1 Tax=Catenulispora yoronensis TaxID=450799 RepID=UPI0031DBAC1A